LHPETVVPIAEVSICFRKLRFCGDDAFTSQQEHGFDFVF
jgi:hypothetical protein